MKAILLAAGIGKRLGSGKMQLPKCLLEFGGQTLLQRHLEILCACGIDEVSIGAGFRADAIRNAVADYAVKPAVKLVHNPDYELGSIVTLWHLREALCSDNEIILMDADVLYGEALLNRLVESRHENCFLMDRTFEAGEEPVMLCVREGRLCEFRKQVDGEFDLCGESVGFMRLSPVIAAALAATVQAYMDSGRIGEPHEEALRDVLLASPADFGYEDITGMPWTEIDFQKDVIYAQSRIHPLLSRLEKKQAEFE